MHSDLRTLTLLLGFLAGAGWDASAAGPDYSRDVKPLLAQNCYRCHGASQQKGGLRLDTAASALKGGEHGPAFSPGHSAESLLVRLVEGAHADIARMPYKKPPLADAQIALLKSWIDSGAKAPADEQPERAMHWAFVPPSRPEVPQIRNPQSAIRNPIDAFILARLEREGIAPSPEASRLTLLRRLSLDLLGLPPTPAEIDQFLSDTRPGAYERLVERLLSSPHYGERWGRWWLDAARYADSNGYSIDAPRSIWKYRDWVIAALNRDLPFDRFALWQLAGDLVETNSLPRDTQPLEPLIATGFHRNTQINQEGGIDPEQFRVESVVDRVNTTATVFLGVTLGCAQCHDHKFDPFTQRDYYRMFAFFNSTVEDGHGKGTPGGVLEIPGEFEGVESLKQELEEVEEDLDRFLNTKGSEQQKREQQLTAEQRAKLKPDVEKILNVPFAERTKKQKRVAYAAFQPDDPEFASRNTKLKKLEKREPKRVSTLVMRELAAPRDTHLLIKGDFTRPGEAVTPGTPEFLTPLAPDLNPALNPNLNPTLTPSLQPNPSTDLESKSRIKSKTEDPFGALSSTPVLPGPLPTSAPRGEGIATRLDLARWIVATNNPLTARVLVNRVWQQYFGRGLVETENDFGTQGALPTHPELLDWLAWELMAPTAPVESLNRSIVKSEQPDHLASRFNDSTIQRFNDSTPWSLKHLHRLIVTSAAYRQSSRVRPELRDKDPNNKLLARQSRLRLDAEVVRDVALAASGLLSRKMGGPPVYPPQPAGVMSLGQSNRDWKPSAGADRHRRGVYTWFWRATPHPALAVFDAPDAFSACTRRLRSNTPLQALTLLNDQQFYEMAEGIAARVLREAPKSDSARLDYMFRLCVARLPSADEKRRLQELLATERRPATGNDRKPQAEAWTAVARVLLNLDETITRE
ncbi:MAG TPA: PSD1 and planctomycete cytochrome C domain-containing protein [Verrucomicrobiae bacterium]|nr:PSD1 and planctomycete cytochrome C domain-containing protein [Verrucomicrobiae bacterium]